MADVKKGDRVIRNERYYVPPEDRRRVYEVTSEPWPLGDGTMVVSLAGKSGGFPVDGLDLVAVREDAERSGKV